MTTNAFTLFVTDSLWRIGRPGPPPALLDVPPAQTPDGASQARAALALLRQEGYAGEPLVLALPSAWCLCAFISTQALPRRNRRQAMLFRLEEKLPAAAEDLVADFVVHANHALGVCTLLTRLEPLVADLEAAGAAVEAVCPASLMALRHLLATAPDPRADAVLWGHDGLVELLFLVEGRPAGWHLLPDEVEPLAVHLGLRLLNTTGPLKVLAAGLTDATARELAGMDDVEWTRVDTAGLPEAAAAGAAGLLRGHQGARVNLRRDRLAVHDPARQVRRPLRAALAAAAVFLACLTGAVWSRTQAYRRIASDAHARARRIFHQTLPNQPVPMDIRSRMDSEARKLQALRGQTAQAPRQPSALLVLHEALRRLSDDVRFRLLDIRVQGESLVLEGATRSHALADRLAASLRAQGGFAVEPPRTKARSDGGIDFTLRATLPSAATPPEKRP